MNYLEFYTEEQKSLGRKNHQLAIEHFKSIGEWIPNGKHWKLVDGKRVWY